MRRRDFIKIFGSAAVWPLTARAQQPSPLPVVGYLEALEGYGWAEAFQRGMSNLGYVANLTVIIERRSAAGQTERLPSLAAELVHLRPQVIVASTPPATLAVKKATETIPIVMTFVNDPVALGLVANLARPGGNVTGLSNLSTGLMGKRLELLLEIASGLSRVGAILDSTNEASRANYRELQAAAVPLHLTLETLEVRRPEDFDAAFAAAATRGSGAAVLNNPMVLTHYGIVVAAAARHKVPTIYFDTETAEAGGLISYGANTLELHRRAAVFVDKILKGAKPADLPIEQATKFTLAVNLKTAKALGLKVPQSILVRADTIIE